MDCLVQSMTHWAVCTKWRTIYKWLEYQMRGKNNDNHDLFKQQIYPCK